MAGKHENTLNTQPFSSRSFLTLPPSSVLFREWCFFLERARGS